MAYEIRTTEKFEKEARKLIRKFPSLKTELKILAESLSIQPEQGTSLGKNFFKVRIAIKSKGRGKSGGARVITNLIFGKFRSEFPERLYLATIYDKSERPTITEKELTQILSDIKVTEGK